MVARKENPSSGVTALTSASNNEDSSDISDEDEDDANSIIEMDLYYGKLMVALIVNNLLRPLQLSGTSAMAWTTNSNLEIAECSKH